MTELNADALQPTPARRVPGKYIVYAMVAFGAVFMGFMLYLAIRLDPAADRFHHRTPATTLHK